MRRILLFSTMLIAISLMISACGPTADNTGNVANKPANAANAAKPVDTAAIETDVKKVVTEASAAMSKNDVAAFEKMTVDTYKFIGPDGKVSTKSERAASLRSGDSKYESVVYDEVTVNPNPAGTGAIVIGRATVKGVNMGQKVDGQFRITQIWRKTDDGWKMAHGHATAIAAGSPSANTATNSNAAPASNSATNANK